MPAVLFAAALSGHHYRVSLRDERYRFEVSAYGVRDERSDRVPWNSITTLRERTAYNRLDLIAGRDQPKMRLQKRPPLSMKLLNM